MYRENETTELKEKVVTDIRYSSVPASDTAIRNMIKETDGDRFEAMRSLEQNLTFDDVGEEFRKRNVEFGIPQMKTLNISGEDGLYTNLGLLLSDQCPHTIKAAVFQGTDQSVFKTRHEFEGSLMRQLNEVYDYMLIFDIDKKAVVLELPKDGDQVLVQAGIIKTRVPMSNLRLIKEPKTAAPTGPNRRERRVTRSVARGAQGQESPSGRSINEVDLRGQMVEEALMTLDQYIDHAILTGIHQITIIHGKGTGALRTAVQQHLRKHPSIKTFRLGVFGEGESGVTIAELK